MKPIAILFLACSILLGAENWKYVKEQGGLRYFANAEISIVNLSSERVVQIQSKVVFPRGGITLSSHYWRKYNNRWEAAMKTTDLLRVNGSLRSHQVVNDSKLAWVVAENPTDETWVAILNSAADLLQASK